MRMLVVAAVVACMSGVAFAAELSKTAPTADGVKQWESARCWVCGNGGGNNGGGNGGNVKG